MDARFIALGLSIGAGFGVALGAAIGAATDNMGFWVALGPSMGVSLGLCAGVIIGAANQSKVEQQCEKCGYSTKGLKSKICPECGGTLTPDEPPSEWLL